MCKQADSIEQRRRAAKDLAAACSRRACPDLLRDPSTVALLPETDELPAELLASLTEQLNRIN